jgi:hypothetical protein
MEKKEGLKNDNTEMNEAIIDHLSKEITNYELLRMNFRNRVMAVIYIGPFILFSSVLIGKGKVPSAITINCKEVIGIAGLFISWMVLAWSSANVEKEILNKCNKWRKMIFSILSNGDISQLLENDFLYKEEKYKIRSGYITVFIVMGFALFSAILLLSDLIIADKIAK